MRKYILTVGIALLSLGASAQYMVTTTVNPPTEGEGWATAHFTDNMGIGYMYKSIVAGVVKNGEYRNWIFIKPMERIICRAVLYQRVGFR